MPLVLVEKGEERPRALRGLEGELGDDAPETGVMTRPCKEGGQDVRLK